MTRWMYTALAVIGGMFVVSTLASTVWLDRFPEQIPTHYDFSGKPDDWVPRDQPFLAFFIFPTAAAAVMAISMALPYVSPERFKVDSFRRTYDYVFMLVAVMFAWLQGVFLVSAAKGGPLHAGWLTGGIFLFLALIGNVLGKVRPNFWVGIRTPWTLANEIVWERTHRFAAWLFVAVGVVGLIGSMLGVHLAILFAILMVAALTPVIYSLVLYKRLERAGTL